MSDLDSTADNQRKRDQFNAANPPERLPTPAQQKPGDMNQQGPAPEVPYDPYRNQNQAQFRSDVLLIPKPGDQAAAQFLGPCTIGDADSSCLQGLNARSTFAPPGYEYAPPYQIGQRPFSISLNFNHHRHDSFMDRHAALMPPYPRQNFYPQPILNPQQSYLQAGIQQPYQGFMPQEYQQVGYQQPIFNDGYLNPQPGNSGIAATLGRTVIEAAGAYLAEREMRENHPWANMLHRHHHHEHHRGLGALAALESFMGMITNRGCGRYYNNPMYMNPMMYYRDA